MLIDISAVSHDNSCVSVVCDVPPILYSTAATVGSKTSVCVILLVFFLLLKDPFYHSYQGGVEGEH